MKKKFSEIGKTFGGLTGKTKSDFGSGESFYIPFMSVMRHHIVNNKELEKVKISKLEQQNKVIDGDLIFNGSSETPDEVGLCSVYHGEQVYLNSFCFGYRLNKDSDVDPLFLAYLIRSNIGRKIMIELAQGSTRYNLPKTEFMKRNVELPPLAEQQKIAAVLSDIDALIETQEALIAKKKDVKAATMELLLTGKKRLPGFSGEWRSTTIQELGVVTTGSTPPTQQKLFWRGEIPWVTPTDINENVEILTSQRKISEKGLAISRALPAGTLLVTCIASIGKNAVLLANGSCNQQINAITPSADNDVYYLYYWMSLNKPLLISKAGVTATLMLSKKEFELIELKIPLVTEQKKIAKILKEVDDDIALHMDNLVKTRSLKSSLMHKLLTGEIRLP